MDSPTGTLAEPWGTILYLVRAIGPWQTLALFAGVTLLRVATPANVIAACARLWADVFPLYRDRRRAQIAALEAEADRDRRIAQAWPYGGAVAYQGKEAPPDARSSGQRPAIHQSGTDGSDGL